MTLTRYGLREWGSATAVLAVLLILLLGSAIFLRWKPGYVLSIVALLVWGAFVLFFRNPVRKIPENPALLLSPADGVVKDIELVSSADNEVLRDVFQGGDILRIGIFLSVFDVHLNRMPCDLKVARVHHQNGAYHDARDLRAGKENESQIVAGTASACGKEFPMAVRQVSGAIARRIVCPVAVGDKLERGKIYGMIKFGSRTELYLPAGNRFKLNVQVGDRVQAGVTTMAVIPEADRP